MLENIAHATRYIEKLEGIVPFISQYDYITAILLAVVSGELGLHLSGVLVGFGIFSPYTIVVLYLTVLAYDSIVFFIVQHIKKKEKVQIYIDRYAFISKINAIFKKCSDRYKGKHILLFLTLRLLPLSKFTIWFFIFYSKISFKRFLLYDSIVTAFTLSVITIPGYIVGVGLISDAAGEQIYKLIIYIAIVLVGVLLFGKHIETFLLRLSEKVMNACNKEKK